MNLLNFMRPIRIFVVYLLLICLNCSRMMDCCSRFIPHFVDILGYHGYISRTRVEN